MDPSLWPAPAPDAAPGGGRAPGAPSGCGGAATAAVFWGSLGGALPACPLPAAAPHLLRVPARQPPCPHPEIDGGTPWDPLGIPHMDCGVPQALPCIYWGAFGLPSPPPFY